MAKTEFWTRAGAMRYWILAAWAAAAVLGFVQSIAASSAQDFGPRVVLQSSGNGGIEVAAWSPDDRTIVTATGIDRTVMLIDAATGHVIDRTTIPANLSPQGMEYLYFNSAAFLADGETVVLHGLCGESLVDGPAYSREVLFNIRTRKFALGQPATVPKGTLGLQGYWKRIGALMEFYQNGKPEANETLPALPSSPVSGTQLIRTRSNLVTRAADGTRRELFTALTGAFASAELGPDGKTLALVDGDALGFDLDRETTKVRRFNVANGTFKTVLTFHDEYGKLRWVDEKHFLITQDSTESDRDADGSEDTGPISPGLVVDAETGQVTQKIDGRCFITPLGNGDFIGAGPGNCRSDPKLDKSIQRYDSKAGRWVRRDIEGQNGFVVNGLTVAPDGKSVGVTVEQPDGTSILQFFDVDTGKALMSLTFPEGQGSVTGTPAFVEGQTKAYVPANRAVSELDMVKPGLARRIELTTSTPEMTVVNQGMLLASSAIDNQIERADIASGKALPPLEFGNVSNGGFVKGKPIFWALSYINGLRMWDTRTWQPILTTYIFPNAGVENAFLTIAPDGRYDTNLGPDEAPFRWVVEDAPFQSLAPQTFMRDYFTPRLGQKLFDCLGSNTCRQVLPTVRPVEGLNRLLPIVKIRSFQPSPDPGRATVVVEVSDGRGTNSKGQPAHSGVFDVRLFVSNRLVAHAPVAFHRMAELGEKLPPDELSERLTTNLIDWRRYSEVKLDANGKALLEFDIAVPTQPSSPGSWALGLSAYAFNSDRVKGETTTFHVARPPVQPRSRRAFVLAIGISDYDAPSLALNFGAPDAHLISSRLSSIQGYEIRPIVLTGEKLANGKVRRVTYMDIISVIGMLAVGKGANDDKRLLALGVDPSLIDQTTPDDAVIISFSGHGWADPTGRFFLLGSDAEWPPDSAIPKRDTVLSTMALTPVIEMLDASEIAIVIDACHSAASVATADFKPGPMGDSSLGQLAYDKKLRVIAATQGDDVALETAKFGHGLLSYALAQEGLDPQQPLADVNKDKRVTVDEWFRYGAARLPRLSEKAQEPATSAAGQSGGLIFVNRAKVVPKAQEPALFDFSRTASDLVLLAK